MTRPCSREYAFCPPVNQWAQTSMTKWIGSALAALGMVAALTGCAGMPGADGRYATNDRGRSNSRAEAPIFPSNNPTVGASSMLAEMRR